MRAEKMGELIIDSQQQLYLMAKSILSKDEDCADAISEMIVKVFSKLDTLRDERYAKTWMIRILINECYRILQYHKKVATYQEVDTLYWEDKLIENYEDLYEAIYELKEEYRLPIILYYIQGFSIKEVGKILDVSEGAIQNRLFRARKLLKIKLEEGE